MQSMKCRSCQTTMSVEREEVSKQVRTLWHQCPLCKQVRLTSEKQSRFSLHHNSALLQNDDELNISGDFDTQYATG